MKKVLVIATLIIAMGLVGCPHRYYDRDRYDHDRGRYEQDRGHDYEHRDRDRDDREHRR